MDFDIENVNESELDPSEKFKFARGLYDEIKFYVIKQIEEDKIRGPFKTIRMINITLKLVDDSMDIFENGATDAWRHVKRVVYGE